MPDIELIFFDVGGVLGTNGWDRHERAAGVQRFGLDATEFEDRHQDVIAWWEEGRLTLDEYLDHTVFYEQRPFTRLEFTEFVLAQSKPNTDTLDLVRAIHATDQFRLMTLNNESADLNRHRITTFGLADLFQAFCTSCYLGVRKPAPLLYERAFAIANADPARTLFIDDRKQNLTPATALGAHTILFTSADALRQQFITLNVLPHDS
jgi:putative hydrolase of the HAD superfamily